MANTTGTVLDPNLIIGPNIVRKLALSAGTVTSKGEIKFIQNPNAQYISDATSINDALIKLDDTCVDISGRLQQTLLCLSHTLSNLIGYSDMPYVDLGLPSGKKWMKCNIGASNDYEVGKYFAFGGLKGYLDNEAHDFDWRNTPFNRQEEEYNDTYFETNYGLWFENGRLFDYYDPIFALTGGDYHSPSREEITELLAHTNQEYISLFSYHGQNGVKFTSKTNGNTLFVPAGGVRTGDGSGYQGVVAALWSTYIGEDKREGTLMSFNVETEEGGIGDFSRTVGLNLRGVKS